MSVHLTQPRDWHDLAAVRVPDPNVVALDPRLRKLMVPNARVEPLFTGARWSEGPWWLGDRCCLIWSGIVDDRMPRFGARTHQTSVFRQPAGCPNGNTRDREGRLITCEQDAQRVVRTEIDGSLTVILDSFEGKPLNSPNNVIVASDGCVWVSDSGYGISNDYEGHKMEFELPTRVYPVDSRTRRTNIVMDQFARPNGLYFSPYETKLYLSDTAVGNDPANPATMHVFDVAEDGRLSGGRMFHDLKDNKPGFADGLRVDVEGNLCCGTGTAGDEFDGVHVFAPDGGLIGQILLTEICANVTFGGRKRLPLFMAASSSLYVPNVNARGSDLLVSRG